MRLLLTFIVLILVLSSEAVRQEYLQKLYDHFENVPTSIAPFIGSHPDDSSFIINIQPYDFDMLNVDEKTQTLAIFVRTRTEWIDERLTWNSNNFGGIRETVVTKSKVWNPSYTPCLIKELKTTSDSDGASLMVTSNGKVVDYAQWSFETTANMKFHNFPFDDHIVTLCFSSPLYAAFNVELRANPSLLNLTNVGNQEWKIKYINASQSANKVEFRFSIKRFSLFWVNLIILPCFVLGFLIIAGLVLSTDNQTIDGLVNIGLASTVSTTVVIGTMLDNFPKTAAMPSLGSFVRNQIAIIFLAIITLSIRKRIMFLIDKILGCLQGQETSTSNLVWYRKWLVRFIRFAKHPYYFFFIFEGIHFIFFLYMMRHVYSQLTFVQKTIDFLARYIGINLDAL